MKIYMTLLLDWIKTILMVESWRWEFKRPFIRASENFSKAFSQLFVLDDSAGDELCEAHLDLR
jgi:hypothetical protein